MLVCRTAEAEVAEPPAGQTVSRKLRQDQGPRHQRRLETLQIDNLPPRPIDKAQIDVSECAARILEGLRADAFQIARDVGLERLSKCDGIDRLIEASRGKFFPLPSEEASELFRVGQHQDGPFSRWQSDESMLCSVKHRKRRRSRCESSTPA